MLTVTMTMIVISARLLCSAPLLQKMYTNWSLSSFSAEVSWPGLEFGYWAIHRIWSPQIIVIVIAMTAVEYLVGCSVNEPTRRLSGRAIRLAHGSSDMLRVGVFEADGVCTLCVLLPHSSVNSEETRSFVS